LKEKTPRKAVSEDDSSEKEEKEENEKKNDICQSMSTKPK